MPPTELSTWWASMFGASLPFDPGPLVLRFPRIWASPDLVMEPNELPRTPDDREVPGDHVITGAWGHGVQSHAVYWIERRGAHRAFLRLPWGGAYGDEARDAERVRATMAAFAVFRARRDVSLAESEIVSNMGDERAVLGWPDGRTRTIAGPSPLLAAPPFWDTLIAALG